MEEGAEQIWKALFPTSLIIASTLTVYLNAHRDKILLYTVLSRSHIYFSIFQMDNRAKKVKSPEPDPESWLPENPALSENPAKKVKSQEQDPESWRAEFSALMESPAMTPKPYVQDPAMVGIRAKILTFLGDYPKLPISAPVGSPHIIDRGSLDREYMDLQQQYQKNYHC